MFYSFDDFFICISSLPHPHFPAFWLMVAQSQQVYRGLHPLSTGTVGQFDHRLQNE
jgi:hypothetical protein